MKTLKDVLVVLSAAVLTAGAAALVLAPAPATAGDEAPAPASLDGVTWSVSFDRSEYDAGDEPVLTLVATNGTKAGVEVSPRLELTSTRILSPMSRMIPMPRCICSRDLCLTLPAGKSRTVKIETKTALTAKSTLRVGIALGKKRAPIGDVTALVRPKKVEKPVEKTGDVAQKK